MLIKIKVHIISVAIKNPAMARIFGILFTTHQNYWIMRFLKDKAMSAIAKINRVDGSGT
jgi:hypothetical protein